MADDVNAIRAESAYLSSRIRELEDEMSQRAQDLGLPAVSEDIAQMELDGVAEALRDSGNSALASKYSAAYETFKTYVTRLEAAIAVEIIDEEARDAMNDAEEQFERIASEVTAWFDKRSRENRRA